MRKIMFDFYHFCKKKKLNENSRALQINFFFDPVNGRNSNN